LSESGTRQFVFSAKFAIIVGALVNFASILVLWNMLWKMIYEKPVIAIIIIFVLPGVFGGLLTRDPVSGAIATGIGGFVFVEILLEGYISQWLILYNSVGGFIGGLIGLLLWKFLVRSRGENGLERDN
jgi:hypothetical protein